MIKTDVLVVGSGPAGSLAARYAAMGGVDVILIDKKSEIGAPKRCAEGVSKEGLAKVGVEPNPRWIAKELDGTRLVSPDGTSVWITSEKAKLPESGYILERKVFDKFMAMEAAREGAEIKIKTLAKGLRREDDGTITVECESFGKDFDINAKIVIGADGPETHIGRWAGLKCATPAKKMESGIQFEMCNVEFEKDDVIEFYFGTDVAPGGYAWIFPKGDDIANVGLAILAPLAEKSAYEYLVDFVANCPATKNAQAVELNVGGDPVGGLVKEMHGDNIMLCGDAASQVNPLTGGGINSAMLGGMLAGQTAVESIKAGDYSKKFLKKYADRVDEEMGHEMNKYLKVCEYLLSLSNEDLNKIAVAFQDVDFERVSTTLIVKTLFKVDKKALLKLGKLF